MLLSHPLNFYFFSFKPSGLLLFQAQWVFPCKTGLLYVCIDLLLQIAVFYPESAIFSLFRMILKNIAKVLLLSKPWIIFAVLFRMFLNKKSGEPHET